MNFWAFYPNVLDEIEVQFREFVAGEPRSADKGILHPNRGEQLNPASKSNCG